MTREGGYQFHFRDTSKLQTSIFSANGENSAIRMEGQTFYAAFTDNLGRFQQFMFFHVPQDNGSVKTSGSQNLSSGIKSKYGNSAQMTPHNCLCSALVSTPNSNRVILPPGYRQLPSGMQDK